MAAFQASASRAPGTDGSGITIAALMSSPVVTIAPDATLADARAAMLRAHVHHLLVSDRGRIVAILSDRDIAHRLGRTAEQSLASRHEDSVLQRRVLQVAAFNMATVPASAPIEEAAAHILEHGISALPVVDAQGEVVGIVTTRDLLRGMLACVLPSSPLPLRA